MVSDYHVKQHQATCIKPQVTKLTTFFTKKPKLSPSPSASGFKYSEPAPLNGVEREAQPLPQQPPELAAEGLSVSSAATPRLEGEVEQHIFFLSTTSTRSQACLR